MPPLNTVHIVVKAFCFMVVLLFFNGLVCEAEERLNGSELAYVQGHKAWKILEKHDCGESGADRIIGGKVAALGQFPWIVRLGYNNTLAKVPKLEYRCAGALISPELVITAAHCVVNLEPGSKLVTVRLGELDSTTDPDCQGKVCAPSVQDVSVQRILAHESFNNPAMQNDIAIVRVSVPAVLGTYVAPICLPKEKEVLTKNLVDELLTVAGWGVVSMRTNVLATSLQTLQVPMIDPKLCKKIYAKVFNFTKGQICAGAEKDKDSCAGDSGGPLVKVLDDDEGPKTFLIGVVSTGPKICGMAAKPGLYTSVVGYLPWILDHVSRIMA